MIRFEKAVKTLEFDKVLNAVKECALTEGAVKALSALMPSDDIVVVRRMCEQTQDAKLMLIARATPPLSGVRDILPSAERAEKGATLNPRELLDIAMLLESVSALLKYRGGKDGCGCLCDYFDCLTENRILAREITVAIAAEDLIADEASDRLYGIRRDVRRAESKIRDILSKYTGGSQSKYLQENIVTMRGGRYVIPVKAEYRNEVKGLLHDTSASGATLFIEPIAVLEENNKIRELKVAESVEIERILAALSEKVSQFANQLKTDYEVITDLAVIFAKAQYAYRTDAVIPTFTDGKRAVIIKKARHPLLPKDKVVPISVEMSENTPTLIITGPNTGGKTVTLKTLGLLSMMAQAGLHVPCSEGTVLPIYSAILPDIGDEQSIEQSLSTFSSHMVNIVNIINECNQHSLVLFDELGAGTDPVEGAALAIAILEKVHQTGATVAATTHYSELKLYAIENPHVLNASCEFDVESLKPTYRLVTGLPGKSNAFAISLRLGIPPTIIDRAREIMAEDNVRFDDILTKLDETESKLAKEKNEASRAREEAQRMLEQARAESKRISENAERMLATAQEQARSVIAGAKASGDFILDELNALKRRMEKGEDKGSGLEDARKRMREELNKANDKLRTEKTEEDEDYVLPRPLVVGDRVMIADIRKEGVIDSIKDKTASVIVGSVRIKSSVKSLRLLDSKSQPVKQKQNGGATSTPRGAFKCEIDLRGQTGDDAWFMTDRYIDHALQSGYTTVTLIHGKGTGALRAALWQYLKGDKRVKSYRSGRYGEGDTGVTILELV